ncbi:MAG: hypothetical protein KKA07_15835, partial [Bacteroidetes bacterium]|nr:hypothetical protein [Bacteroidota bacterium]MBU1720534.1 hypothetical protein [Bacteroidota bacterium]
MKHSDSIGIRPFMVFLFFVIFALITSKTSPAQPEIGFQWMKRIGYTGSESPAGIVRDQYGNIIIAGTFTGTTELDPGPDTLEFTTNGQSDIFFAKYDTLGNLLWGKRIGGVSYDNCNDIAYHNGYFYITGYIQGSADFDPGVGAHYLTPEGSQDIFLAKYDENGDLVWAKNMGGFNDDVGQRIKIDNIGNIILCGKFYGTCDFDPSASTYNLSPQAQYDIFMAKYTSGGVFSWAKRIQGDMDEECTAMTLDASNNILLGGTFNGTVDLDPGAGVVSKTASGAKDAFIASYSSSGVYQWSLTMIGSGNDLVTGIHPYATDDIYAVGKTIDTLTGCAWVVKMKSSSEMCWVRAFGDSDDGLTSLDLSNQYLTVVGYFYDTLQVDSTGLIPDLIAYNSFSDVFIARMDTSNTLFDAKRIGGASNDYGYGILANGSNSFFALGTFYSTVDFDPGYLDYLATSKGSTDMFFEKFKDVWVPDVTYNPQLASVCEQEQTFFMVVTDGTEPLTYRWQEYTGSWTDVVNSSIFDGAENDTLFVNTATGSMDGYEFRCIVSNPWGIDTSDAAILTVAPPYLDTIVEFLCDGMSINVGSHTYSSTGIYSDTMQTALGCDSVIVTDLVVIPYGETLTDTIRNILFDGRDCHAYPIRKIENYWWMAENVNIGYPIGNNESMVDNLGIEKYCYLDSIELCDKFGALYQWNEAMQYEPSQDTEFGTVQGICPLGWHIPTRTEWQNLRTALDGNSVAGGKMKASGSEYWASPNAGATNESGLSFFGSGYRNLADSSSTSLKYLNYTWAATQSSSTEAYVNSLMCSTAEAGETNNYKTHGFSVRCVKNRDTLNANITASSNVTCYGLANGSATVTPTGGYPPYQYEWSNGESDSTAIALPAGWHTVTVSDNNSGEVVIDSIHITQPMHVNPTTDTISKFIRDDRRCYIYPIVKIGDQWWMAENVNESKYTDGTPLVQGVGADDITGNDSTKFYFDYNDDPAYSDIVGKLYTWAAIMNEEVSSNLSPSRVQGICPEGWNVPSDEDWHKLALTVEPFSTLIWGDVSAFAGGMLKDTGTTYWTSPNSGATNDFGFSARGSGYHSYAGSFALFFQSTYFWTSTENSGSNAIQRRLLYNDAGLNRGSSGKSSAFSVRCIYNTEPIEDLAATFSDSADVSCFGGEDGFATITPSGGIPPYSYQWSVTGQSDSTISDLSAGWYYVTVSDINGSVVDSIEIIQPDSIVSNLTYTLCEGQSWDWNGTIISAPGTYNNTWVAANGCDSTVFMTVTFYPVDTTSVTQTICHNDSLLWNGNYYAATGIYYHTTTSLVSLCDSVLQLNLTVRPLLVPTYPNDTAICRGTTVTLKACGGSTYKWSNNKFTASITVTPLSTTTYTVTVYGPAGCSASDAVTVTVNPTPTATVSITNGSCGQHNGEATVIATGGTAPYNYFWTSGDSTATVSGLDAGMYMVTVVDLLGCKVQ